ncbi:MAG: amidase [Pseudomonadota bacterium]
MRGLLMGAVLLAACNNADVDSEVGNAATQPPSDERLDKPMEAIGNAIRSTANRRALGEAIMEGRVSSEEATKTFLDSIEVLDANGPQLRSVLAINPQALDAARNADASDGDGLLNGLPVLIKDNIETRELPTTAGSRALINNATQRDAPAVARLRAEGAVILGKANLSEWANFRSLQSISGWSALGGQTRNPHDLTRNTCGSSSGSGAAVAAGLAWAALGTETNGSITCPSAFNGIVGFKPTVGMVSRRYVVPVALTQDTIGPMTTRVFDAAMIMNAIAGTDPDDPATAEADQRVVDFVAGLEGASLEGVRLGVLRWAQSTDPKEQAVFEEALKRAQDAGAILVDIHTYDTPPLEGPGFFVVKAEFKAAVNAYLAEAAPDVTVRSLSDVIAFNEGDQQETALFSQDILVASEAMPDLDDQGYRDAVATTRRATGPQGIDKLLADNDVAFLIAPSNGLPYLIDPIRGDIDSSQVGAGWMAALAGYPHLTLPMGGVRGLPLGLSIMGTQWDDAGVLRIGQAFEEVLPEPLVPSFRSSAEEVAKIRAAQSPAL